MKKAVAALLTLLVLLTTFPAALAEEDVAARIHEELEAYRPVRDVPTAYEADSWKAYNKAGKALTNLDPSNMSEKDLAKLNAVTEARENLRQLCSPEDCMLYIWGEDMATLEDADSLVFDDKTFDGPDFRPFLLPYCLEDPSDSKGSIIVVAGGGYSTRANDDEGYAVAERFRELGYNCFVLQRRVAPYGKEDIWMDLQRALRFLRYNAAALGLGEQDHYMAIGFSGGSGTVLGAVQHCYGDVQPTIYDEDYVPDDVDAMSADFDAVCAMYGPNAEMVGEYEGLVTDNPNLPEVFIAAGQLDYANAGRDSLTLAESLFDRTKVELHLFADTRHGFSLGMGTNNSSAWVDMADGFFGRIGN